MEYIRDYANTLNTNESVRVADIKKFLSKSIEDACGLTPNMNTISRQLIASIVNNPTRIHYGVSQSNQQNYNWFYYPNVNNRSEVCFSTIPGARNPDYIKENIEVYNFKLSEDDMKKIRGLDKEKRFFTSTLAEIQHFKDWNPGD